MVSSNAHKETSAHVYLAIPTSAQGTPTVDPTTTALQKLQLTEQVDRSLGNWIWNYGTAALSTLVLVLGGIYAFFRWFFWDRRDARKKQAEERFKSVVDGLGSESTETKIASAVLLRTFLDPGYKEFYTQVFDLAVANLRLRKPTDASITAESSGTINQGFTALLNVINKQLLKAPTKERTSKSSVNIPESPDSFSPDSFSQALITVFKEAFPLTREELKKQKSEFTSQLLDATGIQLDNAFLFGADLRGAWMPSTTVTLRAKKW
jgi:hypothetical protein